MLTLLGLLVCAPPDLLAPSIDDLDASLERLERRVEEARASDESWARAERAWLDAGGAEHRCRPVEACARRVVELRAAAREARWFAQAARAEWLRSRRMTEFPPLRVLVRGGRARRWGTLTRAVERATRVYVTRLAWHRRFVERWAARHARAVAEAECEAAR